MKSNIPIVLEILKNEVDGDVRAALEKMSDDYSMTWMYKTEEEVFPTTGKNVESEMDEVYTIKGRQYDIRNIAESDDVVMVELIESYPDSDTGNVYRTPLVLVLEVENGKIKTGHHYCDPRISYEYLSEEEIERGFNGTESKQVIESEK